jgi:tetratricopeptide (TPR) repeat protein/uncharacterized protein HemY
MPDIIRCPGCHRRLALPEEVAGRMVCCPSCRTEFPALSGMPADAPATTYVLTPSPEAQPLHDSGAAPRASRPARPPAWSAGALFAVIGGSVLVVGIVFGIILITLTQARQARQEQTRAQERWKAAQDALADPKPAPANNGAQDLDTLFNDLGRAFRDADGAAVVAHFDLERMADDLALLAPGLLRDPQGRHAFLTTLRDGLTQSMRRVAPMVQWKSFEIRSTKNQPDGDAVVLVRHEQQGGGVLKMRWWVSHRSGSWKIYDFEDLSTGLRITAIEASVFGQGVNLPQATLGIQKVGEAMQDVALRQDLDGAEKKLQEIAHLKLPREIEAVRHLTLAMIHLHRNQPQPALDAMDQAQTFQADMPILDLLRGLALNQLRQPEKALKHLEAFRDLLGEDMVVCTQIGESLLWLQRFPEAAREYRKALDFNPQNADAFYGLLHSLDWQQAMDDVGPRFAKLDNPREHFELLIHDCEQRHFPELTERLCVTMGQLDPAWASPDYHLALVRARATQADRALPLFKTALGKETDAAKRAEYVEGFLSAMAQAGKAVDAYTAVPDGREAFRILAPATLHGYRQDALRELVDVHTKKHADDPLLAFYRAELALREGRYALADKSFTAAFAGQADDRMRELFRNSRVLARYHIGQGLTAYREIGPRDETFRQLAELSFNDGEDALLESLLDAHAHNDPDSVDVPAYRSRLKVHQGQTDDAVALFKEAMAKRLPDDRRAQLLYGFLYDMANAGKPLEAYHAAPEASQAFRNLAATLLDEDRLAELDLLIDAHRKKHAADPWLAYYHGEIHLRNQAWEKAVDALKEGMKKAPEAVQRSLRWKLVYALYKAGRGMQAYAEVEPRDSTFSQLAQLYLADKKGEELAALVQAHRPHASDEAEVLFQETLAQVLRKQPAEAIVSFQKAWEKQTNNGRRQGYLHQFLNGMEAAGHGLDAYRAVPDKPAAFQAAPVLGKATLKPRRSVANKAAAFESLASMMVWQKKDRDLAALLAEHGKVDKDSPTYHYYQGQLHLLRGDARQAETEFEAALDLVPVEAAWRYRDALFRTRIKRDKVVEVYGQFAAQSGTFEQLANLCIQEKNGKQLQSLVEARRKARPTDPDLPFWDLEEKRLNQDHEGTLKLLTDHRADLFDLPRWRWKTEDYRVRCLVKLKRAADAIQEAEKMAKRRHGGRVALLLAHASTGNVKQTIATMEKHRLPSYELRSCYQDADLGPILRGEAFAAFREKFPEPKLHEELFDRDLDD